MVGAEDLVAGVVLADGGQEAPDSAALTGGLDLEALTEVRDLVAHRPGGRELEARPPGDTAIRPTGRSRSAWVAVPSC